MAIIINMDVMLAKRKMSLTELSEKVGITMANLSILKTGKAKAIRFSTLESICEALDCQPGDILEYKKNILKGPESYQVFFVIQNLFHFSKMFNSVFFCYFPYDPAGISRRNNSGRYIFIYYTARAYYTSLSYGYSSAYG